MLPTPKTPFQKAALRRRLRNVLTVMLSITAASLALLGSAATQAKIAKLPATRASARFSDRGMRLQQSPSQALAGNWTITDTPNVGGTGAQNFLFGLNCIAADDCWAAGYVLPAKSNAGSGLIEHFNGAAWSVVTSPDNSGAPTYLQGLTCNTASDCWAVGYYSNGTVLQTLIEHYDGTAWSIVGSPNMLDSGGHAETNQLFAVTCTSANDCWAVGVAQVNAAPFVSAGTTLVEHYDGASWSIVSTPSITGADAVFYSVTCINAGNCWAVGNTTSSVAAQTLIEHYDGLTWSIAASANSMNEQNYLYGVTCAGPSDCWAVGYDYTQGVQPYNTLTEHYDGTSWSLVTSPDATGAQGSFFQAVTCVRTDDCWAVGYYVNDSGSKVLTLAEHYDGTAWSITDTPNPDNRFTNDLQAVSCLDSGNCWAIGYSFDTSTVTQFTLAEHYVVPSVPLVTSVSRKVHGSAGAFDIDLTSGTGIECRSGGDNGNYTLVFSFANTLASVSGASTTSGSGSVASSTPDPNDAHNYIVNLTGVTNGQTITVALHNVIDSAGNFSGTVTATMKVLVADVNGTGLVDSGDVFLVRQQTAQAVTSSNFREDVNANGLIDSGDVFLTRQHTGSSVH
jgi:hypothetical protein